VYLCSAPKENLCHDEPQGKIMNLFTLMFARVLLAPLLASSYSLSILPRPFIGGLGRGLGLLLLVLNFRKRIVTENLNLALGKEKSPEELITLRKEFYKCIGLTFLEIARNFTLSQKQMREEIVFSEKDRKIIQEIIDKGKGAVCISAHIANWELLAMGMAAHGYPISLVVKKMNNPFSQVLIERQRIRADLGVIYSGGTIEKIKLALKQGTFIGFMMDQNTTGNKGIRANFFGVPASSIRGLAGLARDTSCIILPLCSYRQADGRHRLQLMPELPYLTAPEFPEGSSERLLREEWLNTQQYQTALEQMVRKHPEQWMWIHRRWKTNRAAFDPKTVHLENRI